MKFIIFFIFMSLLGCTTPEKNLTTEAYTLSSFESIPLGTSSATLEKIWSQPQKKGSYDVEGAHFMQWEYNFNQTEAWFLIDQSKGGIIVEKVFFPIPHTRDSDLHYLTEDKFKDIKFEKVSAKCAHFGELAYVSKSRGLFIISHDVGTDVPVAAIAMDTPELVDLRIKEDQNRRCSWH
jgi:hypothetical protein